MVLLITYVLIALGVSFLCSLLEATLLTVTPSAIEAAKQRGAKWAVGFEKLKGDIDKPLSAILTLNTVAHTMGATGAGAQYTKEFGDATGGIFAGALTLAILVFTEIIPKTLGARYAIFFAPGTARVLPWLQWALAPLVWLCQQITRMITFGKATELPKHREELLAVAQMGADLGELHSSEVEIVRNILKLREVKVSDIMTPRSVIYCLPESTLLADLPGLIENKPFSRIPVYGENRDEITGFVIRADALLTGLKEPNGEGKMADVRRPVEATQKELPVDRLFQRLLAEGHHIMLVNDEFGTTVGLVTLEDVLETIMGVEIVDEKDQVADLQLLARRLWKDRAKRMGVEELGQE
jgi:CBS domain containing-hemolysin-like protein